MSRVRIWIVAAFGAAMLSGCAGAQKSVPPGSAPERSGSLIPREVLFGNPDKAAPKISPDGTQVSWLAAVDGVLNVWVAPVDDLASARPVTRDDKRGIRRYFWAFTGNHIVYLQDKGGDENWRLHSVNLKTGARRDLTPFEGVAAQISQVSHKHPNEVLVGLNKRTPKYHDIHRVDLETGKITLVQKNDEFAGFVADDDFRIRFGLKMTDDGGSELFKPGTGAGKESGAWASFLKIPAEDTLGTNPVGFDKTGTTLYLTDSRGRDTSALVALDLEKGGTRVLAEDSRADLSDVMMHPTEKTLQAASFTYERTRWQVLDDSIRPDLDALKEVSDGDIEVVSRTLDDSRWVVAFVSDTAPTRYYRYDRKEKKAEFLFTTRKDLEDLQLAPMHPVVIESEDGLSLVSYLSLPLARDPDGDGRPDRPIPMVLLVHGGPWARDHWGLNPMHQWIANRGYAVLSVNYRGSTGFGKEFVNAGNLQWAAKMHDDLIDAVDWAVEEEIADREKVSIMGGSYGGYATLVGLTFTPDVFACGVDIVGPSNLVTLLETIPPYWAPMMELFATRVGDPRTEKGRALLAERSPLSHVDKIQRPLLIGQGANDPRVKQSESDQIVRAMEEKEIPVTYVLYPDEGHGFARPENRLSFYGVTEAFLAEHLGGRFEPLGDDLEGSSMQVPAGSDAIHGLSGAIQ